MEEVEDAMDMRIETGLDLNLDWQAKLEDTEILGSWKRGGIEAGMGTLGILLGGAESGPKEKGGGLSGILGGRVKLGGRPTQTEVEVRKTAEDRDLEGGMLLYEQVWPPRKRKPRCQSGKTIKGK